ncbi:MAG TPA: helix-turn-helix domain-containing protein [Planctomycetes bacterium]|nr:helix-turn-helix domain-containing protein [Planctomycetota bacterium]
MNTIPPEFRSYSLEEVAALMEGGGRRISVRTLQEYCRKGVLRGVKIGAQWRVSHLNLSAWLNGDLPAAGPAPRTPSSDVESETLPTTKEPVDEQPLAAEPPATGLTEESALPDPIESKDVASSIQPALPGAAETTRTLADLVEEELAAGPGPISREEESSPAKVSPEQPPPVADPDPVSLETRVPQAGEVLGEDREAGASTLREEFYPSGRLKLRYHVRPGTDGRRIREGLFEAFYESGEVAARGHYAEGRLDGAWEQWHRNGRRKSSGRHAGGLKEGPWVWWDEDGRKTQEGGFRAGLPHGAWVQWHPNGKVWCRGRYENGEPKGKWEWFDGEGRAL